MVLVGPPRPGLLRWQQELQPLPLLVRQVSSSHAVDIGNLTRNVSRLQTPPSFDEASRSPEEHVTLQAHLRDLGQLPQDAKIDGVYGPDTRTAIAAWQQSVSRPVTGYLSVADARSLVDKLAPVGATTHGSADIQAPRSGPSASGQEQALRERAERAEAQLAAVTSGIAASGSVAPQPSAPSTLRSSPPATVDPASLAAAQITPSVLVVIWHVADQKCRGGGGDDFATESACNEREAYQTRLTELKWCYGDHGQIGAEARWKPCATSQEASKAVAQSPSRPIPSVIASAPPSLANAEQTDSRSPSQPVRSQSSPPATYADMKAQRYVLSPEEVTNLIRSYVTKMPSNRSIMVVGESLRSSSVIFGGMPQ